MIVLFPEPVKPTIPNVELFSILKFMFFNVKFSSRIIKIYIIKNNFSFNIFRFNFYFPSFIFIGVSIRSITLSIDAIDL